MIYAVSKNDLEECVNVIRSSFKTVADEFGFTEENAPRFTAFATTYELLIWQYEHEKRPMFAYRADNKIIGYYSLLKQNDSECELNNLCVLSEYRHKNIGRGLLEGRKNGRFCDEHRIRRGKRPPEKMVRSKRRGSYTR